MGPSEDDDAEAVVAELIERLRPATQALRKVLRGPAVRGDLFVGVTVLSDVSPAIGIAAADVTWLGDLGISIGVDVIDVRPEGPSAEADATTASEDVA